MPEIQKDADIIDISAHVFCDFDEVQN